MTLAEWVDINTEHKLYPHDILVVGQKNGSYNTSDQIFSCVVNQEYAKQLFGQHEIAFINIKQTDNNFTKLGVFLKIEVPKEMKSK